MMQRATVGRADIFQGRPPRFEGGGMAAGNSTGPPERWYVPNEGVSLDLLETALFLLFIWVACRLCSRMRVPEQIGALAAGVISGPQVLDFVPRANAVASLDPWRLLGTFGVTLLIFEFGTRLQFAKIHQIRWRALSVALLAVALPIASGMVMTVALFGANRLVPEGLAVGFAFTPTSPMAVRALDSADLLTALTGQIAMLAVVLVMVLSLVLLAYVGQVSEGDEMGSVAANLRLVSTLGFSIAFLGVTASLARCVFPRLKVALDHVPKVGHVSIQPRDELHLLAMLGTLCTFAYVTALPAVGSHLVGTFAAGMCFVKVARSTCAAAPCRL